MDILELDAQYKRKIAGNRRALLLKLLPFLVSSTIYFSLWLPEPSLLSTLLKCLPTISLAFFVAAQSKSVGVMTPYARRIFQGLLLSCVGDACLVWPQFFFGGMGAFAICHVSYISAFGLVPLQPLTFLIIAGLSVIAYVTILLPCLSGIYVWAVPLYSTLLVVMAWRAFSYSKGLASVGSLIFILSDLLVAHEKFCPTFPLVRVLFMSTYYLAQSLIAVSVVSQKISQKEN